MELLRKEFQDQTNVSTGSVDPGKKENGLFDAFHSHLELSGKEPKQKDSALSCMASDNSSDSPDHTGRPFASTPVCSPGLTPSSSVIIGDDRGDILYSQLSKNVPSNAETGEVDSRRSETGTNATDKIRCENPDFGEREFHRGGSAGCSGELGGLEGKFSESLRLSHSADNVAATEQQSEGFSSGSEF